MVQEGELALTIPLNSTDSVAETDTLIQQPEPLYGLVLPPPEPIPPAPLRTDGSLGISFIICGLFLLFFIIALRFRNNFKYVTAIFRNLIEIRTRQNVFNDTVRETSLIVLLNLLWCACAGIIGATVYTYLYPEVISWSHRSLCMLMGMALASVYILFMWAAYGTIGWIFSDRTRSLLWIRGFLASQALMSPAFFIIALIGICRPDTALEVGMASVLIFIFGKLIFIWRGYRIFFNQFSSWVLFLCYLCSLEIIPLILCYRSAVLLGEVL